MKKTTIVLINIYLLENVDKMIRKAVAILFKESEYTDLHTDGDLHSKVSVYVCIYVHMCVCMCVYDAHI